MLFRMFKIAVNVQTNVLYGDEKEGAHVAGNCLVRYCCGLNMFPPKFLYLSEQVNGTWRWGL